MPLIAQPQCRSIYRAISHRNRYLDEFLGLGRLHELGDELLLDSQDDALVGLDADGCGPEL